MHAAFLTNRSMRVKIGNILSDPMEVTGGAVQGSILGVLDHNAVIEHVDEDFPEEVETQKYVDDMTIIESIPKNADYYMDEAYEKRRYRAENTEKAISSLKKTCEEKNLKINASKTQLLAISANKEKTKVWIREGEEEIVSGKELKLLGFYFSESPDVSRQIKNIIQKAMLRFFVLRRLTPFMPVSYTHLTLPTKA